MSKTLCDSVGGGVIAEIFRDLEEPMRFSGGGSSRNFSRKPTRLGGGGNSAELFRELKTSFSVNGALFYFFTFLKGGPDPLGPPLNRPLNNKKGIQSRGQSTNVNCCTLSPSCFVVKHVTWGMTRLASREYGS